MITPRAIIPHRNIDLTAIDRADLQPTTKAKYKREITNLLQAGINPLDFNALTEYADGLKSSRKAFLKSALRLMTIEYEDSLKGRATADNISEIHASVYRLEAMRAAVKVRKGKGKKAHTWLSADQVKQITRLCKGDLEGMRDWIILGLLLGAGLRREELAGLTFEALKRQPLQNGQFRDVLQVKGKGAKDRVIPIKPVLGQRLREWRAITNGGRVARSVGRKKRLSPSMSAVAIFKLVNKYGALIGIPELAPHDLRRTYAQLGYEAGIPITQISQLLGHENIATTQKYLDLELNLENTASDFIPLSS